MAFTVAHGDFSGPVAVLHDLIERKQLPITEVSLAAVTDEYLNYLESNEVPSDELADFLLVASRLIYLKSRELIPYLLMQEEEEGIQKLEDQLRLYREFVAAAAKLEERYLAAPMFARPYVKIVGEQAEFVPAKNLSAGLLHDVYRGVLKRLEPFFALRQESMERVKSIEERIDELHEALKVRATVSFQDVVAGHKHKGEVVVSFLALLELLRRQAIRVRQHGEWGNIVIERSEM